MRKKNKNLKLKMRFVPPSEEDYLKQLKEKENSIKRLSNADFKAISDEDIRASLTKIFYYNNGNGAYFMPMNISTTEIPENELLFRIRTIDSKIKCENDLWYPPAENISKRGRLNDIKEPILYTTSEIQTALAEMRIEVGQEFYLLFYKVINPINLIDISPSGGVNSQYKEVEEIISNFLIKEFSISVPETENERYKVSNIIGKVFYDYKSKELDGWSYPSAVLTGKKSLAIDSKICKEKINFLFIAKGKQETETDYSLEEPRVLNKNNDNIYLLSNLVTTGEINEYDPGLINDITSIWNFYTPLIE